MSEENAVSVQDPSEAPTQELPIIDQNSGGDDVNQASAAAAAGAGEGNESSGEAPAAAE